ncbi:MAG: 3-oxoadipate enol-lactonase [Mesorhizobium sp.]|uniref:3-oxoadipate enol-lactonase n=1 Tax=Mesorhizobium sp. TaxID=1871066 RepID=UPI000FE51C3D|nr:3-oxoadipate enol-lactonase [Mesorhizobium sp.]RWB24623.1 MAG: 3-oxoadipate enol-lactonase [Mesorhizobium sp.]RWD42518.1 MAG: 3-oxoadipate enol-lactonase [Mesorhizobium sp.]RWF52812.1 MAG: 3-oxoadipate enol-lactonase [Mesorhizobium sp.]TIT05452.1 MAG: 3-oxoadipate enol-lactonase [Mesorhizobium sp.]TIY07339.1 MAG: 3-oxoadipate enol-lactonase [Mesorhizobium sp.]
MAFVRANGIVLHTKLLGQPEGPALVFSNSLGSDFRIWEDVATLLGQRYRILLYDKRGHGLSDAPTGPYTIDDHTDDLLALLDHFGFEATAIVGVSLGGMIAQRLAARAPDRAKALVLCCTATRIGTAEGWANRITSVESGGIESVADGVLKLWFTEAFRRDRAAEFEGWRNMLVRTPAHGYLASCVSVRDADLRADAAGIAAPVLCVAGDQDGSTPPDLVRGMADLIPNARFVLIEGAGHIACVEKPGELAGLIENHLDGAGHG